MPSSSAMSDCRALTQCFHEINDLCRRPFLWFSDLLTALLSLDQFPECELVVIFEFFRAKMTGSRCDDVRGKVK